MSESDGYKELGIFNAQKHAIRQGLQQPDGLKSEHERSVRTVSQRASGYFSIVTFMVIIFVLPTFTSIGFVASAMIAAVFPVLISVIAAIIRRRKLTKIRRAQVEALSNRDGE